MNDIKYLIQKADKEGILDLVAWAYMMGYKTAKDIICCTEETVAMGVANGKMKEKLLKLAEEQAND